MNAQSSRRSTFACIIIFLTALTLNNCSTHNHENTELADLYERIDQEISASESYQIDKERRISALRSELVV